MAESGEARPLYGQRTAGVEEPLVVMAAPAVPVAAVAGLAWEVVGAEAEAEAALVAGMAAEAVPKAMAAEVAQMAAFAVAAADGGASEGAGAAEAGSRAVASEDRRAGALSLKARLR